MVQSRAAADIPSLQRPPPSIPHCGRVPRTYCNTQVRSASDGKARHSTNVRSSQMGCQKTIAIFP